MKSLPEPLPITAAKSWKMADFKKLSKQVIAVNQHTELQQYIAQVLDNNPDLKSLSATAKAASYSMTTASAEVGPRADLNLSGTRNKNVLKETSNSVSVGVDVSWDLDVWGKFSDNIDAAQHLADKAQYDLQQLRRILIIQSASLWVEYRGYVYIEKHLIKINKIQMNLVGYYQDAYQGNYQGLTSYEFFLDAKNSQSRSQSRLQKLQLEKLKTQRLMNILRGRLPTDELSVADDRIAMNLLIFTDNIPATALENRPDIQAGFSELHAFRRSESAAYKALLPQINLTASASKTGTTLEKALRGDLVWQLIGGLTQPLFNRGQLNAIAKQKSAQAEVLWWQYQNTVLKAMLEVENALTRDKLLAWQIEQKQAELGNLGKKRHAAETRFSDGDLSLATYFLIKEEYIETQIELNNIESSYIKNRFALIMALGLSIETDWKNHSEENNHEKS
ncbi:MAG: TolC family protein [Gammaproteobacteria bacterium]|nr:TolC family protein [Gammaproteobacteria bacterium]